MAADLKEALHFPHHIVHTQERPDIVIWSNTVKRVIIVELTVPWENMEEAFERKKLWYENLRMECEDKGWACQVMAIEVGCRGFIGRTTTSYLTRLGLANRARRRATQQLQTAVERASSWIWSKVRKSTTAWINHPPSPLLPYPHPTPPQHHPSPTLSLPPPPPPSLSPRVHTEHPGSRRNHLNRSGRWLTRVMSRQLLLHVVCIYYAKVAYDGTQSIIEWLHSILVKIFQNINFGWNFRKVWILIKIFREIPILVKIFE